MPSSVVVSALDELELLDDEDELELDELELLCDVSSVVVSTSGSLDCESS